MPNDDLYLLLNAYLTSAQEILSNWGQWLSEHEQHVLQSESDALAAHAESAGDLQDDLLQLSQRRTQLLALAHRSGLECSSLKQLAQRLPQWNLPDFRSRVRNVELCMVNLRRLHTAAWMLVNQCTRVVDETLLLMTSGSTMQSVYVEVPHADTGGGQILDTEA